MLLKKYKNEKLLFFFLKKNIENIPLPYPDLYLLIILKLVYALKIIDLFFVVLNNF